MTLDFAFANVETALPSEGLDALRAACARDPRLAGEVEQRLSVMADLQGRLSGERSALRDLAATAASMRRDVKGDLGPPTPADGCGASEPPGVVTAKVDDVAEGMRLLAAAGDTAENTRRAYASALRGLDAWLHAEPERTLNDITLSEYLAVLAARGRGASRAAQVVAAAKRRAELQRETSPAGEKTAEALRRHRRHAVAGLGQVRGISWEEADRMGDLAASAGDARGLRDAALIAVTSDALLRVSEVANIQVEDVVFEDDGTARLLVRRSKTDQRGSGALLFLGPRTAALVRDWSARAAITKGPLFRRLNRAGSVAARGLGAASVRRVIVRRAAAAGIGGRVSGHSLRVGSAQSLAKRGAGLVAMQKAGRWASPEMPARYTRSQAAAEGAIARLRHQHGVTSTACAVPTGNKSNKCLTGPETAA